jgi:uncharacterized protein
VTTKDLLGQLRQYKELNREKYYILRIGIFGSAAKNKMGEKSDLDIVVELGKPDLFTLIGIKQDLEEKFQRPVDIIRYRTSMNKFLKDRIEKEAIYA